MKERLQKVLAAAGVASRRRAEELILSGRVRVNGQVVAELGVKVDRTRDAIEVDGEPVRPAAERVVFALYKPRGVLTTLRDPRGRPTVADLVRHLPYRLIPVGRLDRDSEGLLLLTNDGDLAYRLTHPRFALPKTYWVTVRGHPAPETLERLQRGVLLDDGPARADRVEVLRRREDRTVLAITVHEGRNRLLRRLLEAVGHEVLRLKRVRIGGLQLGRLAPGSVRRLTAQEVARLIPPDEG